MDKEMPCGTRADQQTTPDSALDNVQFDGINLDCLSPKPFDGGFNDLCLTSQFKRDDAHFLRDIGVADIEDQIELPAHLADQRLL